MGNQIFDEGFLVCKSTLLTPGSFPGLNYVFSNTEVPSRVDSIIVTSTDSVDHDITVSISYASGDFAPVGTFTLPAGSGNAVATPPIEIIPLIAPLLSGIVLPSGSRIAFNTPTDVTVDKQIAAAVTAAQLL